MDLKDLSNKFKRITVGQPNQCPATRLLQNAVFRPNSELPVRYTQATAGQAQTWYAATRSEASALSFAVSSKYGSVFL